MPMNIDLKKAVSEAQWSKNKWEFAKISDLIDFFVRIEDKKPVVQLVLTRGQKVIGKVKTFFWDKANDGNIYKAHGIVVIDTLDGTIESIDILDIQRILDHDDKPLFNCTGPK